jgi:hypothetical protein
MNDLDVRMLAIRCYARTSLAGPKMLVPSSHGVYGVLKHTKLYRNISKAEIMPKVRHLSVSSKIDMVNQRNLLKLCWFCVRV